MRKEIAVFVSILILTILVGQYLPGYLEVTVQVVQERMLLVLLPILLLFVWWVW